MQKAQCFQYYLAFALDAALEAGMTKERGVRDSLEKFAQQDAV
jgi:hypothetical protein